MKALVFGSLNIDYVYQTHHFVRKGETLASTAFARFCGGKGLNQAISLSRAGMDTYMAGAIGPEGDFLLQELKSAGVNTGFVAQLSVPTGHAVIQNTPDGDNAILLYGGANRAITCQMAEDVLANFERGDLLLVQNEISDLRAIVHAAKERGMRIAVNPSPMESSLIQSILEDADFLILNSLEGTQLLGEKLMSQEEILEKLSSLRPYQKIVLTLGEKGAMFACEDRRFRQPAFAVNAVDTTGAGDTFTGYFLASYFQCEDPEKALRTAAAAAAISVTMQGAARSIPDREMTRQFLMNHSLCMKKT